MRTPSLVAQRNISFRTCAPPCSVSAAFIGSKASCKVCLAARGLTISGLQAGHGGPTSSVEKHTTRFFDIEREFALDGSSIDSRLANAVPAALLIALEI